LRHDGVLRPGSPPYCANHGAGAGESHVVFRSREDVVYLLAHSGTRGGCSREFIFKNMS